VQHAEARLVLPDRLHVHVTERKPEVRWMHDGTAYAVTWDGRVIDQVGEKPAPAVASPISETAALSQTQPLSETVPVTPSEALTETGQPDVASAPLGHDFASAVTIVDTTPNRPLKVGDHVDSDALELARRVTLRAPTELPRPIARIEWDAGLGVSLIVDDGRQVVLGKSDDLDRKLATLRWVMSDNTPYRYLDLRPNTPYYR